MHNIVQEWKTAYTSTIECLPRPVYFRAYSIEESTYIEEHQHVWWQFLFSRQGLIHIQVNDTYISLPSQYGVWIPPKCPHKVWAKEKINLESLYIDSNYINNLENTTKVVIVNNFVREFIHHACTTIPVDYDENGTDGRKIKVLIEDLITLPDAQFNLPFPHNPAFFKLCLQIQKNPCVMIPLKQAADYLLLSERTFSRLFLKYTGIPYTKWCLKARLLYSLELLVLGKSVTEIAFDLGYSSPSAFIHAFKSLFNTTPNQFIKTE